MSKPDDSDKLQSLIEQAAAVFKSAGAAEVYLFGSAAKGLLRIDPDIDLAATTSRT